MPAQAELHCFATRGTGERARCVSLVSHIHSAAFADTTVHAATTTRAATRRCATGDTAAIAAKAHCTADDTAAAAKPGRAAAAARQANAAEHSRSHQRRIGCGGGAIVINKHVSVRLLLRQCVGQYHCSEHRACPRRQILRKKVVVSHARYCCCAHCSRPRLRSRCVRLLSAEERLVTTNKRRRTANDHAAHCGGHMLANHHTTHATVPKLIVLCQYAVILTSFTPGGL
jgi:hypothetical protein